MDEREILRLADYHENFQAGGCSAELIINQKMADYPCLFGFATLTDQPQEVKALFDAMEQRAQALGAHALVGPVNYCSWMSYRWAVSRFDLHLYPDCSNPPFYPQMIQQIGYRPLYTYRSAQIGLHTGLFEAGEALCRQMETEGFTFTLYEGEAVYTQADTVFAVSRAAFRGSPLYCDIPAEYFRSIYLQWTRGLKIALYTAQYNEKVIGYVMGYESPDGKCFISKTSAVLPEYRRHGIYTALMALGWRYVAQHGYSKMMYHFQCEQKQTFRRFSASLESDEKRYAVFIKEL